MLFANFCTRVDLFTAEQVFSTAADALLAELLNSVFCASSKLLAERPLLLDFCKRQGKNFDIFELEACIRSFSAHCLFSDSVHVFP